MMKFLLLTIFLTFTLNSFSQSHDVLELSKDMLLKVKTHQSIDSALNILAELDVNTLQKILNSDENKKTFFINLYNALVQHELRKNPSLFEDRNQLFTKTIITLAHQKLSLDDIEHGLLRKSQVKWGFGYIKRWFPENFQKELRVKNKDYRIHFALNCGAGSCPAIAFYEETLINADLNEAEAYFVESQSKFESSKNSVTVSMIFKWFIGDFGGKKGIYELLEKHKIIPKGEKPKIVYAPYNWNLLLEQYRY